MNKNVIIISLCLIALVGCSKIKKTAVKSIDDATPIIRKSISLNNIDVLLNKKKIIRSSFNDENALWILEHFDTKAIKKLIKSTNTDPILLDFCNASIDNLKFWKKIRRASISSNGTRVHQIKDVLKNNNTLYSIIDIDNNLKIYQNGVDLGTIYDDLIVATKGYTDGANINPLLFRENLFPDSKYFLSNQKYSIDKHQRTRRVFISEVKLIPSQNRPHRYYGMDTSRFKEVNDGFIDDQKGHILANRFGGASDGLNLFAQSSDSNKLQLKHVEDPINMHLTNGRTVTNLQIDLNYDKENMRPLEIIFQYKVDGVLQKSILIENRSAIKKMAS